MASAPEVRDALLKLDKLVRGDKFQGMSKAFIAKQNGVFEFSDENKLEYTDVHSKYQEQIEEFLSGELSEVELEAVMTGMSTILDEKHGVDIDRNITQTIDVLTALTDFQFFKDMMLEARREGENTVIPEGDMSSDGMAGFGVPDYEFLFDELKTTSESGGWKVVTDKKWCRLEDKEINSKLYNRVTVVMDLSPEQTMDALRMDNPDVGKWFPVMERMEVLKEYGPMDHVVRVYTKFERFASMIPGMPAHIDVRVICRPDFPEKGCTCLGQMGWDVEKETVKATKIFKVRTTLARPMPGNPNKSSVVSVQEATQGWMPNWMRNSMMSSMIPRMFNQVMVSYRQVKGITTT